MENKSICYYCGTIYNSEQEKCPLCGSTVKAKEEEIQRPQPRRRLTEQERKERQRAAKGKYVSKSGKKSDSGNKTRPILIAALVFLILAVLVVFYFIGDMIGWWPGLEDTIDRYQASVKYERSCQTLLVEPEEIKFLSPGETATLVISVNASCEEELILTAKDPNVVAVSQEAVTEEGEELKSAAFTLTAMKAGKTEIQITCGEQSFTCPVECKDPANFVPELDCGAEVVLSSLDQTVKLEVLDLPSGMSVTWTSDDDSIASVDANGLVQAVHKGETTVTAEVNGKIAQVLVRCDFEMPIDEGAKINLADVTLTVGEKFRLSLIGSDGERIEDVSYTVKHPEICEVEDGYVTGLKKGTTKVIITYGEKEFECIVRVR